MFLIDILLTIRKSLGKVKKKFNYEIEACIVKSDHFMELNYTDQAFSLYDLVHLLFL